MNALAKSIAQDSTSRQAARPLDFADDYYIRRGWWVLPLCWPGADGACACGRGHQGRDVGKAPLLPHGVKDASASPVMVQAWKAAFPCANIGVAVEPSGLLIIDADGPEAIAEVETVGLPSGVGIVQTGSGRHYWFKCPPHFTPKLSTHGGATRKVDLIGTGYVVAPPSLHQSGNRYTWIQVPGEQLPEPPAELLELFEQRNLPGGAADLPPQPGRGVVEATVRAVRGFLPARARAIIDGDVKTEDRSGTGYELGRLAVESGIQDPFTIACLVFACPAHQDKFRHRGDAWLDAWRCAARALAARDSKPDPKSDEFEPVLTRLSDVQPQEVQWLWNPYLPVGKFVLLEGDPSAGKTWIALSIAAVVTRQNEETGRPPGNVVYMTGEDGLADTIRPRFDRLAGDASRLVVLEGKRDTDGRIHQITLSDVNVLRQVLRETQPKLLVVDPIQAFFGAQVDFHRANETRPVLEGLRKLAEEFDCTVLCIRHLTKAPLGKAIYRGLGTIDFSAHARSILLAGADPTNPQRWAMVQIKNSVGPLGKPLAYEITDEGLRWLGESDITAARLLGSELSSDEESALREAEEFLKTVLAEGPVPAKVVKDEAKRLGIKDITLRRAKAVLGVKATPQKEEGGRLLKWEWSLPTRCS